MIRKVKKEGKNLKERERERQRYRERERLADKPIDRQRQRGSNSTLKMD